MNSATATAPDHDISSHEAPELSSRKINLMEINLQTKKQEQQTCLMKLQRNLHNNN
jgi:hypothetical protein